MSFRTVARFALVGWLGMSLAAPAAAQSPPGVRVLETRTGSFLFSGSVNTDAPIPLAPAATLTQYPRPELAPMPRAVPVGRACAEEEVFQTEGVPQAVAPMPREKNAPQVEFGIEIGSGPVLFGHGPGRIDYSPAAAAPMPNPMIALGACRRDDNGTWWVEVIRVPQPKFAPVAKPACCFNTDVLGAGSGNCNVWTVGLNVSQREPAVASCKFSGTWVREMEGTVVAATLSPCGEELKLCLTQQGEGLAVRLTVTADCKVTKEGLVHGAITGVDVDVKRDPKVAGEPVPGDEVGEAARMFQEMVDAPFSFRMKQTSAGLMVSNLKVRSVGSVRGDELAILCGMFKPCRDGAIPTPKPMRTQISGMTLPSGRYLEHYPQYFSPDPQFPLPRELASQEDPAAQPARGFGTVGRLPVAPARPVAPAPRACGEVMDAADALRARGAQLPPAVFAPPPMACPVPPCLPPVPCPAVDYGFTVPVASPPQRGPASTWNPVKPANVPANEFGMMADVFGQMIGARQPPSYLPPVPPTPPVAVQTLGYVVPPPPPGQPAACPPCPLPTSTRPSVTGTWVREVGPVVYVVKIAPDHLTISVTAATEVGGGKTITQELVLTADYHPSRDGTTLVGLITGVDSTVNGELTGDCHADLQALQEELSQLQKTYTDKPYAMNVRVYGDSLVIGNVRLPQAKDVQDSDTPLGILGGRYKNATDKPLPRPRTARVSTPPATPPCAGRTDCLVPTGIPAPSSPYAAPGLPNTRRLPSGDCPAPPPAPVTESPRVLPAGPAPNWSAAPPSGYGAPPVPQQSPRPSLAPPVSVPPPGIVPRELEKVTLPPDNRVSPPAPAVEPMVPPMAVPTPIEPKGEQKPVATGMAVKWQSRLVYLPDPTRNGEKVAGLSGQLFLSGPKNQPASAEGELTVTLHDDTPRAPGTRRPPPERWVIDSASLRKLAVTDERSGQCYYRLSLPWVNYWPSVTRVRLSVSFRPADGGLIHSIHTPETKLTLDPPAKPDAAPTSTESPKTKKQKKKAAKALPGILLNQYSSHPDERMQQLLYQSEDLRQIKNEWQRFWFNDHPSHLTPERIHGGIR